MNKIDEVIIVGGGNSIKEGISLGLKEILKDKFVIVCNYAFKHFPHTFMTFADRNFYVPMYAKEKKNDNPDIYEELKKEKLIVGIQHNGLAEFMLPNTILVKHSSELKQIKNINQGLYVKSFLTGIFSMSLASFLLDYQGRIFLLGFDWNKVGQTHYYNKEEINHRGQGFVNHYKVHNPSNIFSDFNKFHNLKIYNVSLNSNISNFEKIDYNTFFQLLSPYEYNQDDLYETIQTKIKP